MAKCFPSAVIKTANKYVGYLEKNNNSFLDDFKNNAGTKNYTKFAREFKAFTGLNLQGQAWCDMWVDSIFVETYGIANAKKLLGGFSAYTPSSANLFKNINRWYESDPKVGDVIFFKNPERINHTGLVVDVSNTKVYTIEGNTSSGTEVIENGGGVFRKEYYITNQRIAGYGRPNYDVEVKPIVKVKETYKTYKIKSGDTLSKISLKYLKDANRYKEIMKLNNLKNTNIDIGQVIILPKK